MRGRDEEERDQNSTAAAAGGEPSIIDGDGDDRLKLGLGVVEMKLGENIILYNYISYSDADCRRTIPVEVNFNVFSI